MSCARREAGLSAIPAALSSLALGALLLLATTPAAAQTQTDTTAPAFESAAADGAALVITFDEDLAAAASLANSAFTVEKTPSGGVEDTVTLSTTAPVISGETVTLTLATALVYTDGSVKVSYNKPTAGSANKLADADGNETASFTDQTVTNNTAAPADTTAPAFESAAADGAALVITFDEDLAAAASLANSAFTVEKTPSGGVEDTVTLSTTAPVISGKTVTLTLATALVYTDGSVKVSYNKPTAGSANKLADAGGNETASFTDQTVTNNTAAPADTTAPAFESAAADGAALVITFDEDLAAAASLANSAFTVEKTPSGGVEDTVTLSTTAPVISGKTVTLTLATALVYTDGSVKVSYNKPTAGSANKLADAGGNETASFTDQTVTNNTAAPADTTAPAFESAAADGAALVITFDEDLAAAASLANSAFTVKKTPSGGVEDTVTLSTTAPVISGKTVTLTLATALVYTDGSVKVSYNKPTAGSANKLADADGNETASFTDQTVTNNTVASDRAALIALYNATDGANWTDNTNWLSNKALSEWNGVSTDRYDRVTRLYLPTNELSGEIPVELGVLAKLQELWLNQNMLRGEIPVELGNLTSLTLLWLGQNELSGTIPVELGNLTDLQQLALSDNMLNGTIPVELGNLTDLYVLSLWGNMLNGTIPVELGVLAKLQELLLNRNELSGTIPVELGNLASSGLWYLDLSENMLSGKIPEELGNLTSLQQLYLWDNELSGKIPAELEKLTLLQELSLSQNMLSGEIPAELGNLTSLQKLYLQC